jgi:hypothetical protein
VVNHFDLFVRALTFIGRKSFEVEDDQVKML